MHSCNSKVLRSLILLLWQMLLYIFCVTKADDEIFSMTNCLSQEFRLSELLRLKLSLDKMPVHQNVCESSDTCIKGDRKLDIFETSSLSLENNGPAALALKAERKDYDTESASVDYHHPTWLQEEKPSKLQTLFQITITALAFLSFGGYLLCLIVQAIKSKGTTYFHPIATDTTITKNSGTKRIKVYRRSRRYAGVSYTGLEGLNLKTAHFTYDDSFSHDLESEGLRKPLRHPADFSKGLLPFAEDYVKF